eukprot:g13787.t1
MKPEDPALSGFYPLTRVGGRNPPPGGSQAAPLVARPPKPRPPPGPEPRAGMWFLGANPATPRRGRTSFGEAVWDPHSRPPVGTETSGAKAVCAVRDRVAAAAGGGLQCIWLSELHNYSGKKGSQKGKKHGAGAGLGMGTGYAGYGAHVPFGSGGYHFCADQGNVWAESD